jgi:choline kinase
VSEAGATERPVCAVILAAGSGRRLSSVVSDRPKGFVELAGAPIVERSVRQLRAAGIERIVIATGYAAAYYQALAPRYPEIELVENEKYEISGSMFSFWCVRDRVPGTFLLLESDLVYESRALEALLACPRPNAMLVSGFTHADDEVFVAARGERVSRLSKKREELENVVGEMVGISKISPGLFAAMVECAAAHFPHDLTLNYEDCINSVAERVAVFHHRIDDLVWAEIDTPEHLQRVERFVLPRLGRAWEELTADRAGRRIRARDGGAGRTW